MASYVCLARLQDAQRRRWRRKCLGAGTACMTNGLAGPRRSHRMRPGTALLTEQREKYRFAAQDHPGKRAASRRGRPTDV